MQEGFGCAAGDGTLAPGAATDAADGRADDAAVRALDAALDVLEVPAHRPAPGERGFTVESAGWPLHVGVRVHGGLLAAQAEVLPPGALEPAWLLHRNRRDLQLVRYGCSSAGAVWVHGELPVAGTDEDAVDGLLGRLLDAATTARQAAGPWSPDAWGAGPSGAPHGPAPERRDGGASAGGSGTASAPSPASSAATVRSR